VTPAAVNLRGLVTSLGAGGSLIAAALCAVVLVAGLLAVGEALDEPADARGGDVTVPGATAGAETASTPVPVPARAPAAPARRRAPGRGLEPQDRPTRAPQVSPPAANEDTSSTGEDAGGGTGVEAPAPPPAEGEAPAAPVRRTAQRTRDAVAPVVEAVPEPVQPTVDAVVDTVEQVAGTADETLAPVTGLLPR
jgi:hypothetical protein